jgi:hypothetical protein
MSEPQKIDGQKWQTDIRSASLLVLNGKTKLLTIEYVQVSQRSPQFCIANSCSGAQCCEEGPKFHC